MPPSEGSAVSVPLHGISCLPSQDRYVYKYFEAGWSSTCQCDNVPSTLLFRKTWSGVQKGVSIPFASLTRSHMPFLLSFPLLHPGVNLRLPPVTVYSYA